MFGIDKAIKSVLKGFSNISLVAIILPKPRAVADGSFVPVSSAVNCRY